MEVLICDDGSTDDLSEVVEVFRRSLPKLKYLHQENRGPAAARNLGTQNASADVVLFLDSDVRPDDRLVETLLIALRNNSDWVGAEARVDPVEGDANILWDAPVCQTGGVYLTAAIAYRKSILIQVGGFDENFLRAACEDVEIAARILSHGQIGFVHEAHIRHPRRRRTFSMFWKKRSDWRYVLYLAQRHGFIGWPGNRTANPRLRLLYCATITQPAGRLAAALRLSRRQPFKGLVATAHAGFSCLCGLAATADILSASCPPAENYLFPAPSHTETKNRAA
jgi:glycosyltransferase involved in cell wall biosynthesis